MRLIFAATLPWYLWVALVLVLAALALFVAALRYYRKAEGEKAYGFLPTTPDHPDRPGAVRKGHDNPGHPFEKWIDTLEAERLSPLEAEVKALARALEDFKQEVQDRLDLKHALPGLETKKPADPAPSDTNTTPLTALKARLGEAFVEWCNQANKGLIWRHARFSERLQETLPDALVKPIYLDKNSVQSEFGASGEVTNSVEYWLVQVRGQQWILPHPQNENQFRDLACFKGDAVQPRNLSNLEPATVLRNGDTLTLGDQGRIS